ncbi:hypothetical protein [Paenibacillus sp. Aloe-11]|uniref:hypothetical protein n=1 Tax=Paenibacillus sp. Aloe-11 TaxID=1050222 RepID=UPI00024EFF8A|nr:hypothetical protein [Paenibacillus sp. Aloe-11]EHS59421.1 hypothetical protein WG8_0636 [Paenibacillus sp. Aloe-11]
MNDYERHGNHVFLTAESAQETIELAITHIADEARRKARSKAFEDCTAYWKAEIEKIHNFGGPPRAQLSRILNLFKIEVREEEQS